MVTELLHVDVLCRIAKRSTGSRTSSVVTPALQNVAAVNRRQNYETFFGELMNPHTPGAMMGQRHTGNASLNRGCGDASLHWGFGGWEKIVKWGLEKSFIILSSMDENQGESFKTILKKLVDCIKVMSQRC